MQNKRPLALMTSVLILSLATLSGCKSGVFKTPDFSSLKRPDFSSMAFWKKDQSEVPPPPAHHFEPAPTTGKVAESDTSDIQKKFNEMIREAQAQKQKHNSSAENKPFPLGKVDGKDLSERVVSEASDAKTVSYVPELDATVKQAQQDFSAAIANTKKSLNSSVTAGAEAANQWKNDFQLPNRIAAAESKAANTQEDFNMMLDEANRKLRASAAEGQQAVSNALHPNLNAINDMKNQFLGQSVDMATQAANSVKQSANHELGKVQAEMALAQQQIEELKRQVAEAKQQALQEAGNTVNQAVQDASQLATKPLEHIANLQIPTTNSSVGSPTGNFSPLDNSSPSHGSFPNNTLRSNSLVPVGPSGNGSVHPGSSNEQPVNQYPSTNHNGFSSNLLAPQNSQYLQPVSAQTTGSTNDFADGSQVVSAEFAEEPGESSHVSSAAYVGDVEIPAALLLNGNGSFAPGSVTPLTPR